MFTWSSWADGGVWGWCLTPWPPSGDECHDETHPEPECPHCPTVTQPCIQEMLVNIHKWWRVCSNQGQPVTLNKSQLVYDFKYNQIFLTISLNNSAAPDWYFHPVSYFFHYINIWGWALCFRNNTIRNSSQRHSWSRLWMRDNELDLSSWLSYCRWQKTWSNGEDAQLDSRVTKMKTQGLEVFQLLIGSISKCCW